MLAGGQLIHGRPSRRPGPTRYGNPCQGGACSHQARWTAAAAQQTEGDARGVWDRLPMSVSKGGFSMRVAVRLVRVLALVLLPTVALAQATITGTVRDTSGAILPGVTVEASSPALIEKVRTVVTDGSGQYRIVDLRPGVYSLTVTLPGFNTFKRDGIELSGSFTAQVNAELRVGALEE